MTEKIKLSSLKMTLKNSDISPGVENFENIVYDIVKKHCFVEPTNPEQKRPKTENKDVVLERLKRQKKYFTSKLGE